MILSGGSLGRISRSGGHSAVAYLLGAQDSTVTVFEGDRIISDLRGIGCGVGCVAGNSGHRRRPAVKGIGIRGCGGLGGIGRSSGLGAVGHLLGTENRSVLVLKGNGVGSGGNRIGSGVGHIAGDSRHRRRPAAEGVGIGLGVGPGRISRQDRHLALVVHVGADQGAVVIYKIHRVALAILCDLQILQIAIEGIVAVANVVKDQILAVEPIRSGSLGVNAHEVIVHGADLHVVHIQVNHIGAVIEHPVGQAVDVGLGAVDAIVGKQNAEILMAVGVPIAQGQQAAVGIAEQEGCVVGIAAIGGGQQEGAAGKAATGLPFHAPGAVVHQHHSVIQTVGRQRVGAVGQGASVHIGLVGGEAVGGDRGQSIGGGLPTVIVRGILRDAIGPDLQVGQVHIAHRMAVGADIAEGEVLTGHPVGGGVLVCGVDVIVVHCAQLHAVHTEVDHIGAVGGDFIGQTVGMLSISVNAVVRQRQTVVVVTGAVPRAKGDKAAALMAEQEGRVRHATSPGTGQHHTATAEVTAGFPFHNPRQIMLQNHGTLQAVDTLGHHVIVDIAVEPLSTVEHVAAIGDGNKLVIHGLPTVVGRTDGALGRIVGIAVVIAHRVIVGIGCGFPALDAEEQPSGGGANRHVLDLKQTGIVAADHTEGQAGVVLHIAGSAFHIINRHDTVVDGLYSGVTAQGQEHLAVVVVKALLGEGGVVNDTALHTNLGHVQRTQLGQRDDTAGGCGIQGTGVQGTAGLDHHLDLGVAGGHNLHRCHAGGLAVISSGVGAGGGQLGSADGQPHQCGATGNKQVLHTVHGHGIQRIGMAQIGEISSTGGGVGHIDLGTGILVQSGHERIGIITIDLGAVDIVIVRGYALNAIAIAGIVNVVQVEVIAVVLLRQLGVRVLCPGRYHCAYHQKHQAQQDSG